MDGSIPRDSAGWSAFFVMNSRERIQTVLSRSVPDKIPIDFAATTVSGFHVSCIAALRDYYGLEKKPVRVIDPYQMLGQVEEELKQVIGLDTQGVFAQRTKFGLSTKQWKPWRTPYGLEVLVPQEFNTTVDKNGDILLHPQGDLAAPPSGRMPAGGFYFDSIIRQEPIDEDQLNPKDNLEEFTVLSEEDLSHFEESVRKAQGSNRAVVATLGGMSLGDISLIPGPSLKHPKGIRDIAEWYISTRTRRDFVHQVFSGQTEIALENLKRFHSRCGNSVDVAYVCGTDFGTQSSAFCSVETFRELYLPYYKKVNDWIHRNTRWKTFKHSCGSVEKFIESFIEAGFDILNPVQCSALGMDPQKLKATYGDRIVFWGGGVDTQHTLPFGTADQVRQEVLTRCEIFSRNGGYVFTAIHNVQALTPVENIVAMINAVHEFNGDGR